MSFILEPVLQDDIEKYGLREINKRFFKADLSYEWVIDRAKDVYLRWMVYDREEPENLTWSFYWKGTLLRIRLKGIETGTRGGAGTTTWSLLKHSLELSPDLAANRQEIVEDLKNALSAFKDFGLHSRFTSHTAFFEF